MWGVGCIMAEMWTRTPIMQGRTEQNQLFLISKLCGSINPETWPGVQNLDLYKKLELPSSSRRVISRLRPYTNNQMACDLIDKLLCLDPSKRIDANSALEHDFFWTDPMPCSLEKMLSSLEKSMFQYSGSQRITATMARQPNQNDSLKDLIY